MTPNTFCRSRFRSSVWLSVWSGFGGWLGLNACLFPLISLRQPLYDEGGWFMVALLAGVSAAFTFGAAVFFLLPTLLLVRASSRLWRWPTLGAAGGIVGGILLLGYEMMGDHFQARDSMVFCLGVGGFTGTVTGVCASWLRRRRHFQLPKTPDVSAQPV